MTDLVDRAAFRGLVVFLGACEGQTSRGSEVISSACVAVLLVFTCRSEEWSAVQHAAAHKRLKVMKVDTVPEVTDYE